MRKLFLIILLVVFNMICISPSPGNAISHCNGWCQTLDDCSGQLICINGKCNDDPDVGTHICKSGGTTCRQHGNLQCDGKWHPTYTCSPPVTSSTPAKLTLNSFEKGGEGGGPSECDGHYHGNNRPIVALSTGWYNNGSKCFRMVRITASNGRSVVAQVVDECDSMRGCDEEHAWQPPCRNNIVDGSRAVWEALGLNQDDGIVDVTWSMA